MRESDGSARTRFVTERGLHDQRSCRLGRDRRKIPGKAIDENGLGALKQGASTHANATSDDDLARTQGQREEAQQLSKVARDVRPARIVVTDQLGGAAESRGQGGPRQETLYAVAMERTRARELITVCPPQAKVAVRKILIRRLNRDRLRGHLRIWLRIIIPIHCIKEYSMQLNYVKFKFDGQVLSLS